MLEKLQIEIDIRGSKCWISSIMNPKSIGLWLMLSLAIVIPSCAPPPMTRMSSESAMPYNGPVGDAVMAGNRYAPPQPAQRPGLATGWGERKKSNIRFVEFERSSDKPAGTDRIYYNDEKGIEAMAGSVRKVDPLQVAAGGMVQWGIKGDWGYLKSYRQPGHGRRFVVGRKGSNYSIVVKNISGSPLEVVCSVDGLDVQDGKTAAYSKRGYIIDPEDTVVIEGFRTSSRGVAAFTFSTVADSYANLKHGDSRNVGVIGLAVFTPKGVRQWATAPDGGLRGAASPFAEEP